MKNALLAFCLLLSFIANAQNYEEQWKTVADLELDGRVKSASEEVDKIYATAKKDKNEPQIIKTFFYKSKHLLVLEEDAQNKIISNLKKERQSLSEPSKALLESIYAEILDNIYAKKRYEINRRTIVNGPTPQDINAWTSKNFLDEIKKAYQRSLKKKNILYNTPLEKYEAVVELNLILIKTNRSLYDFLAERYINSPLYSYTSLYGEPTKPLIMDTPDFLKFIAKDTADVLENKIILQQEIERFYVAKNDNNSLHRSILRRLRFSYTNINYSQKDETYLNTLISLSNNWKNSLFIYDVKLMLAERYNYLANKAENRDYFIKALEICNEIIENSKNAGTTQRALQLKNNIIYSKIAMSADSHPVSNEPILAKINFKNVDSISLRIYKISRSQQKAIVNDYNRSLEFINGQKPHIVQQYILPFKNDFFEYDTEIIVPALESGLYLAAIRPLGKNIDPKREYGFMTLEASQITLVSQETDFSATYQVLDRISGMPVKGAKINIKGKDFSADKNGNVHFTYPEKKDYTASITAIHKKDTLNTSLAHRYYSYRDNTEEFTATCQLYLDRAIYRPGQTVFFKGIAIQNKNGIKSVVPNIYINITVDDADNNELKTFRLKTNEFGSFTGQFDIPKNALTGYFSITADEDEKPESDEKYNITDDEHPFWDYVDFDNARLDFRVEEYKKPTFEVQFDPISTNIALNEKISVKGTAKAFSSASISGAKVIYAITRRSGYTNHKFYGYEDSVISEGETLTDGEGRFSIDFTTIPNPEFNIDGLPIFTYEIKVAVTDITGEMHEQYFEVYAGYHSLKLRASIQSIVKPESKNTITLSSLNLNDEFMAAEGEIKIYKLTTPKESFLRDRPWPSPEIQTIPEDVFKQNFPYYPYADIKNNPLERENLVFTQKVNTADTKSISLKDFSGWQSGEYELVFTALDSAIDKTTGTTLQFSFEKDDSIFKSERFAYRIVNKDYLKDGYAKIEMHTAVKNLFVNIQAFYNDNIIYDKYVKLDDKIKTIKIPVDKNVLNEVPITFNYVWQNKHYDNYERIRIEREIEKLQIVSTSIKNKIQPGSNETWTFTINGNNKEITEVLASMYDTSLDQFATQQWSSLNINNYNSSSTIHKYAYLSSHNYFKIDNTPRNYHFNDFNDRLINFSLDINQITFTPAEKSKKSGKEILNSGGFIITGTVSDETGPLPGAGINIYGTDRTTQADIDGKFSIAVLKGDILEVSFIGYETSSTIIENDDILNISMREGTILSSVVIDRYRSTTRKTTAAAVTTLSVEAIEDRANASILQSLQGQVAGLSIGTGLGQPGADSTIILRGVNSMDNTPQPLFIVDGIPVDEDGFRSINQNEIASFNVLKDAAATSIYGNRGVNGVIVITTFAGLKMEKEELEKVQTRKNLNETAFFFPQLLTDKEGNLSFTFTSPEALTQWKLRLFAHNKNALSGYFEHIATTQKDLMISPNMPRFFREQDTIVIIAKINNMTTEAKAGNAMLQLYNASTMETIDALSLNSDTMKSFSLDAKGSTTVSWKIRVPEGVEGIQYKVLAKSGSFTDGEESIIPVLSNRMLVTESIPLWVRENTSKEYTIENLKNTTSSTLKSHKLVFEYTSNPAWIALLSLPYLMEYEYNCSEQIFSRFYANAIAAHIVNSNPKIAEVFNTWRKEGKPASKLEQNEELKSLIASESPWMLDAKNEEENKSRMALLFELDKIRNSMADNLRQLENRQKNSGAFSWFEGGEDNEFITRHILAGLGHLQKMSIELPDMDPVNSIAKIGITYIDKKFIEHNKQLKKNKSNTFKASFNDLHYLYTRSYYKDQYPVNDSLKTKIQPYLDYSKENWLSYSLYQKAMAALVLNRFGEIATSKKILVSLKETATNNPEWGMYWKENKAGYYWFNSPIETQALLIEAFIEIDNDTQSADAMKVWLIKNKQNKSWPTTKSTTEAVYALLMKGTDWLSVKDSTTIKLGNDQELAKKIAESEKEAETGYTKLVWNGNEVTKDLATLSINNKSAVPGYGGFYWQYFEDIDKIKPAEQGLIKISKELFVKNNTGAGTEYKTVTNESSLKIGNVIMVRLTLEVKEDLEYVHLKDIRASSFEPVDVISSYERNGGLSYYKSTRDAATHFFFDKVNKGTYILEYEVKVNNAGSFSGGISTMQSMYAPEFSGNSGGGNRIKVNQ